MPPWLSVPFIAFLGLGFVYTARAGRHLAPHITDPFLEFNFRRGLFGGRDLFTERGWRYRNAALRFHGLAAATLAIWAVWSAAVT
jgi:hypothetical protein